jgi:hypothetical protein
MREIESVLADGVDVKSIEKAKAHLLELAKRRDLFNRSDFPVPTASEQDRTFCIYREADGRNAHYLYSALRGVTYRPHDHGLP